jgi:hypothetical protein
MWAMEVPNSVKLFRRRVGHNVLPTRVNLLKKKIVEVAIKRFEGE